MQFLGIPSEKVHFTLERYGNTAAASVPITLHEAVSSYRVQDGNAVVLLSYGGGMTWGSALLRWYNSRQHTTKRDTDAKGSEEADRVSERYDEDHSNNLSETQRVAL
jgi:3-oxoacyl-[acyl-carrier-protein] synthase-3